MKIDETKEIVQRVCTVEGRVFTMEITRAWHDLLQDLDWEVANRACSMALVDHNVAMVTPKHIRAKVPAAIAELNQLLRKNDMDESEWRSDPEPICKGHNLPITRCDPCCDVLAHQVPHLRGDRLHEWAVANLYADEKVPF